MKRISQEKIPTKRNKKAQIFRQGNFVFETGGVIRLNNTTKSDPFDPVRPTSSLTIMKRCVKKVGKTKDEKQY
jgi:hypothetical protein